MPLFKYEVIDKDGNEQDGTIEALGKEQAAAELRDQGLLIAYLEETEGDEEKWWSRYEAWIVAIDTVKKDEIVMLFQQLATMIGNGLSLVRSMELMMGQNFSRKLLWVIKQTRRDMLEGHSFHHALARHPRVFSPLIINMVGAGEISGTLDDVLRQIAGFLESQAAFRRQIVTAFIYPSIVVLMSFVVVGFLVVGVIPKFIPFLKGHAGGMPWATQFLLDFTEWNKQYWPWLVGGIAAFALSLPLAGRIPPVAMLRDRMILKIPVVGMIFLCSPVIRFARNLESMTRAGVSFAEALPSVRDTLGNRAFAKVVDHMIEVVTAGESLAGPLQEKNVVFPSIVGDLVAVGEETGAMEAMLDLVGRMHEFLLSNYVKRMNALVEPILVAFIAGIVGFVGYALFSGVFAVYASLSGGS